MIASQLESIYLSLGDFLPELILASAFLLSIFTSLFIRKKKITQLLVALGVFMALGFSIFQLMDKSVSISLFNDFLRLSNLSIFFKILFASAAVLILLIIPEEPDIYQHRKGSSEFYVLMPVFLLGLNLMSMASNLLMMYLALEMVSLASYAWVAYDHSSRKANESAIKYILFGAMSSAVMLFGLSYLYGFTGTLNLIDNTFLAELSKVPAMASGFAIILVMTGFLFKISAVPFHFYTPDVYEGAPYPVITFLSIAPKAAGFVMLSNFIAVFVHDFDGYQLVWPNFNWEKFLSIIAIATLFVGHLSALAQQNLKRLMAYSSIGHTGFLLMALLNFSGTGSTALLYYFCIYLCMNMAVFMFLQYADKHYGIQRMSDLKGFAAEKPKLSFFFIILLASLIGLPPTGGFMGKFLVFSAVLDTYSISGEPLLMALLISGVLNTVIALVFYFKMAKNMYFRKGDFENKSSGKSYLPGIIIVLGILVIVLGIWPSELIEWLNGYLFVPGETYFK